MAPQKDTKSNGTELSDAREERLRAALRANLQRRKVQKRARATESQTDEQTERTEKPE
ncbi:hypothetical protein FHS89_002611 [Rubricella aquisinus]|uniref:Uncharacterized protein n=1 Tax=Rubricella aquisinus TaxID=2028108 RepID=A0A840WZK0_9RHOB|nr:hypothetical protein [Rubricella aquisinus]MBB5516580.1 hypothetical protein [Rubricella aquisinus]